LSISSLRVVVVEVALVALAVAQAAVEPVGSVPEQVYLLPLALTTP
jgi:hypothetical protein